jgi:HPt (histidine-containing phosphotransfer) domain-containing protein
VLAHQLKGAAGSYGFAQISETCQLLEAGVAKRAPAAEILGVLARLAELCRRATHLPGR